MTATIEYTDEDGKKVSVVFGNVIQIRPDGDRLVVVNYIGATLVTASDVTISLKEGK